MRRSHEATPPTQQLRPLSGSAHTPIMGAYVSLRRVSSYCPIKGLGADWGSESQRPSVCLLHSLCVTAHHTNTTSPTFFNATSFIPKAKSEILQIFCQVQKLKKTLQTPLKKNRLNQTLLSTGLPSLMMYLMMYFWTILAKLKGQRLRLICFVTGFSQKGLYHMWITDTCRTLYTCHVDTKYVNTCEWTNEKKHNFLNLS